MSSLYHITTAASSVPVRDNGGEVTFTVTNATEETLQTRFEVRLDAGLKPGFAKPEWLAVDQPLRAITPHAVEQVKVKLAAPQSEAGEFAFRLFAIVLPVRDERFTASPSIGCSLQKKEVVIEPPPARWWIFLVAGLVLLMIGGGLYYFLSKSAGVPKLIGLTLEDATKAAEKQGLLLEFAYVPSNEKYGTVIEQTPLAGNPLPADKKVRVSASGFVEVPSVVGMQPAAAKSALEKVRLVMELQGGTGAQPVARQNPGPGKRVAPGTRVTVQLQTSQ